MPRVCEPSEDVAKITKDLDEWMTIAAELEEKYPKLFKALLEKIGRDENPKKKLTD